MNANGAAYELRSGRSVMHGLHGTWSLGALAAAGIAAGLRRDRRPALAPAGAVGTVIAATVLAARRGLVADDARPPAPPSRRRWSSFPTADGRGPEAHQTGCWCSPPRPSAAPSRGGALRLVGHPARAARRGAGVAALGYAAFMGGLLAGRVGRGPAHRPVRRAGRAPGRHGRCRRRPGPRHRREPPGRLRRRAGAGGPGHRRASSRWRSPPRPGTQGVSPGAGAATVSLAARLGFMVEPPCSWARRRAVGLRWAFGLSLWCAVPSPCSAPDHPGRAPRPPRPGSPTCGRR